MAYGPRLVQSVFAAGTDVGLYSLSLQVFKSENVARWTLACSLLNWFHFYCLIRPYSNTLETLVMVWALTFWPLGPISSVKGNPRTHTRKWSLALAALAVMIRPTNSIYWLALGLDELLRQKSAPERVDLILREVLPIASVAVGLMTAIDRVGYGEWTFVPWNFIRFNVLEVRLDLKMNWMNM